MRQRTRQNGTQGSEHGPQAPESPRSGGCDTYLVTAPENILSIILVDRAVGTESGREPRAHARGHGPTSRERGRPGGLGSRTPRPGPGGGATEGPSPARVLPGVRSPGRSPNPSRASGKPTRGLREETCREEPTRVYSRFQVPRLPTLSLLDQNQTRPADPSQRGGDRLTPDRGEVTASVSGGAGPDPALSRELQRHTFILSQGCFLLRPVSWACRRRLRPVSSRGHPSVRACVLDPSSRKDASPMGSGPTRPTPFYLNPLFLKTPPPLTGPFWGPGRRGSENERGWGPEQPVPSTVPTRQGNEDSVCHVSQFMLRR